MKKFLKFLGITCTILVIGFIVLCFIPDDEDNSSDYHNNSRYETDSNTGNSGSNNAVASGQSVSTKISVDNALDKQELIAQGLIRSPQVKLKGNGDDQVTVLIYMNGSDLESESSEATSDLTEMINAGSSDKVNVVVQTMGTKKWDKKYGIASNHSQRYLVNGKGLNLVDNSLGQLDCTVSDTLADFIKWGVGNYPADRYILIFWNHGGGPVYGFGYDEWNDDEYASLSADEIKDGLKKAGVYFDFIGMDCCIMSCMEAGCAFYDYADYYITSEDFESGLGWSYTSWLKALYNNTSIATPDLGKIICDSMVEANEKDTSNGDNSILAVVDLSMMKILYSSWVDFAYANKDTLLGTNYSEQIQAKKGGRLHPRLGNLLSGLFGSSEDSEAQLSDYYITDIMAVAQNIDSNESKALSSAVAKTLVYVRASAGDAALTGISVTLPYGDSDFYNELSTVFTNIGLDKEYITWLKQFASVSGSTSNYNYDNWYDDWGGWDDYDDDYNWEDWEDWEDFDDDYSWDDWDYNDSYNFWFDLFLDLIGGDDGDYSDDDYYHFRDEYYEDKFENYFEGMADDYENYFEGLEDYFEGLFGGF